MIRYTRTNTIIVWENAIFFKPSPPFCIYFSNSNTEQLYYITVGIIPTGLFSLLSARSRWKVAVRIMAATCGGACHTRELKRQTATIVWRNADNANGQDSPRHPWTKLLTFHQHQPLLHPRQYLYIILLPHNAVNPSPHPSRLRYLFPSTLLPLINPFLYSRITRMRIYIYAYCIMYIRVGYPFPSRRHRSQQATGDRGPLLLSGVCS